MKQILIDIFKEIKKIKNIGYLQTIVKTRAEITCYIINENQSCEYGYIRTGYNILNEKSQRYIFDIIFLGNKIREKIIKIKFELNKFDENLFNSEEIYMCKIYNIYYTKISYFTNNLFYESILKLIYNDFNRRIKKSE